MSPILLDLPKTNQATSLPFLLLTPEMGTWYPSPQISRDVPTVGFQMSLFHFLVFKKTVVSRRIR